MAVSGDIIGSAYISIQAVTDKFGQDATAKVKAGLSGVEKQAATSGQKAGNALDKGVSEGAGKAHRSLLTMLGDSGAFAPVTNLIGEFSEKMDALGEHAKGSAKALVGIGAAATGVGGLLQMAASKDQAAMGQLQATVEAVGGNWDDYREKVEQAASGEEKYGKTNAETVDALDTLTQATHDPEAALNRLQLVTDLAARKHTDLNSAATMVARAMGGNERVFKQFGITVGKTADGTKDISGALDQLASQLSGQADASANTFTGRLEALKAKAEDVAAALGSKVGSALTTVGPVMLGVGAIAQSGLGAKLGGLFRTAEGGEKSLAGLATNIKSGLGSALSGLISPLGLATAGILAIGAGFAFAMEADQKSQAALDAYAKALAQDLDPSKFTTLTAVQVQYRTELEALNTAQSTQKDTAHAAFQAYDEAQAKAGFWAGTQRKLTSDTDNFTDAGQRMYAAIRMGNPAILELGDHYDALAGRERELTAQDKAIITNVGSLQQQFNLTDREVLQLANRFGIDLKGSQDDVISKFATMRDEASQSKQPLDAMSLAAQDLASGFGDAAQRGQDLQTVLDGIVNQKVDTREALLGAAKASDALSKSFAQNGRDLSFNTAAGQANNAALDQMAQAALKVTTTTFQTTGSITAASDAFNAQVAALDKAAAAAGFNQTQIAALNTSLGLTPGALQQIIDKAGAAGTALKEIPTHVDVEVHFNQTGQIASAGKMTGYASGGLVTTYGTSPGPTDTVATMLTPGEFVVTRSGSNLPDAINHFARATSAMSARGSDGAAAGSVVAELRALQRVTAGLADRLAAALAGTSTRATYLRNGRVYP